MLLQEATLQAEKSNLIMYMEKWGKGRQQEPNNA